MSKELARNIDLTGAGPDSAEKQEKFRACADPAENQRQIAEIASILEQDIHNAFEVAKLPESLVFQTDAGKELSSALGPTVMMSQRDQFFVEQLADRYTCNFGDPIYYMRSRDVAIGVISASMTDNGAPQFGNPLITMKGYDTPVMVNAQRWTMNFEFDDPRLAESNWSSRAKAIDTARYRFRQCIQNLLVAAWKGGFTASFSAAQLHDLPTGRVHPVGNIIAAGGSVMTLDVVQKVADYFDIFGWEGKKMLFVSPTRFNEIKKWVSTTTVTDTGTVFAKQIIANGGAVDSIPVYDVLIVKKNIVPDTEGWALMTDDGVSKTLGLYQFGKVQTLPGVTNKPLRASFDVYVPGLAGVNHDNVRVAKVTFP
jgi:hypothetical protein